MELYFYRATVVRWVDGDTLIADWDLGASVVFKAQTFRLFGINTPELRPKRADFTDDEGNVDEDARGAEKRAGIVAQGWVDMKAPPGSEITIETIRDQTGKFGRFLVRVFVDGEDLNDLLVENGMAERVDYD